MLSFAKEYPFGVLLLKKHLLTHIGKQIMRVEIVLVQLWKCSASRRISKKKPAFKSLQFNCPLN